MSLFARMKSKRKTPPPEPEHQAINLIYQTLNELGYFILVADISSHQENVKRITWLEKRLKESLKLILDGEELPKSLLEGGEPWPR